MSVNVVKSEFNVIVTLNIIFSYFWFRFFAITIKFEKYLLK